MRTIVCFILVLCLALLACSGPETVPEPAVSPPSAEPSEISKEAPAPEPTFTLENVPDGAVFDPETRTFSWVPGKGDAGIYLNACFHVTDGEFTDSECIRIIVLSSNEPPVLSPIPLKVAEVGSVITFTLQASDPDADELEFFARNLPPGAQFSPPSFSWVPTEVGIWPGLLFGVRDGEMEATQRVIIAVR